MEKYFAVNKDGQSIRCKLYYDKNAPIRKLVLFVHGFAGHKDNGAAKKFAERLLSKYKGIALMTFDLPCHGEDVKKKMTLQDCLNYLNLVIQHIQEEFQPEQLLAYATSFGGYLVLRYIAEYEDPFTGIALRCPAVNMAEVMKHTIMKNGDLQLLQRGKPIKVGFDRKIEITLPFLTELENNDIRQTEYFDHAEKILILHGTKDEVVPLEDSRHFADENVIEFIPVENADHRFQNPACMELAMKKIIEFFGF